MKVVFCSFVFIHSNVSFLGKYGGGGGAETVPLLLGRSEGLPTRGHFLFREVREVRLLLSPEN